MRYVIAIALACGLFGCGELNNEDLVFLAGVPKAEEVSIDVAAVANANALMAAVGVGLPAVYYDLFAVQAEEMNASVAAILDFVDSIGRGYPPTERTESSRIWGPMSNVDGEHYTFRFEIRREGEQFRYCLHTGLDSQVTGSPTCDDIPGAYGMDAVIYGTYIPTTDGGGARQSNGHLDLNFEAQYQKGLSDDRGVLAITHAYADSGEAKDIVVSAAKPAIGAMPAQEADYSYQRSLDGRVLFTLSADDDTVDTTGALEHFDATSCWRDPGTGRADVVVSGGDLAAYTPATVVECWDAAHLRTFASFTFPDYPILSDSEGDITQCPTPTCE